MMFSEDDELDMDARHAKREASPLYQKAREILDIVMALKKAIPEGHPQYFAESLLESAMIIPAKIAGAFHSESWVICMQNASIVRYHAQFILTTSSSLDAMFEVHRDYVDVIRKAMLEFQVLFIEWTDKIHALEKNEWDEDEWELYRR